MTYVMAAFCCLFLVTVILPNLFKVQQRSPAILASNSESAAYQWGSLGHGTSALQSSVYLSINEVACRIFWYDSNKIMCVKYLTVSGSKEKNIWQFGKVGVQNKSHAKADLEFRYPRLTKLTIRQKILIYHSEQCWRTTWNKWLFTPWIKKAARKHRCPRYLQISVYTSVKK